MMSHGPNFMENPTEKTQAGPLCSGAWFGADAISAPGYYWCRIGPTDEKPCVVLVNYPEEDQDLLLYEFSDSRGQQLTGYGPEWQFLPVLPPNVTAQPRAEKQ